MAYLSVKKAGLSGESFMRAWARSWTLGLPKIFFREDKDIVEYEQRAYDAQGADWEQRSISSDQRFGAACWLAAAWPMKVAAWRRPGYHFRRPASVMMAGTHEGAPPSLRNPGSNV